MNLKELVFTAERRFTGVDSEKEFWKIGLKRLEKLAEKCMIKKNIKWK
jgi:hypothetical protein